MQDDATQIRLLRLHALAALLDLAGLALVLLQAWLLVPPEAADHRVLILVLCVVPVAFVVFLLVPRRGGLKAETHVARHSLMTYATLSVPLLVSVLTLLLVGVSRSFDSFTGFALVIAADAGRNLCECLRNRS